MNKVEKVQLADYKKANKERKAKLLAKWGFKTQDAYFASIKHVPGKKSKILGTAKKRTAPTKSKIKPTIHNVHILDASGSMSGGKFNNALLGINKEVEDLKSNTEANFTHTLVDFSSWNDIKTPFLMVPIFEVGHYISSARDSTALYQAIGETLTKIKSRIKVGEKVLVKIFTDGGENDSRGEFSNSSAVQSLIKECEKLGFTITFVGTKEDVEQIKYRLSIDSSNTLVHNNTAAGVTAAFATSNVATMCYTSAVTRGENVTKGFYTKTSGTLED